MGQGDTLQVLTDLGDAKLSKYDEDAIAGVASSPGHTIP